MVARGRLACQPSPPYSTCTATAASSDRKTAANR